MGVMSIAEQGHRMKRQWPGFRMTDRRLRVGRWEGSLRPLCKAYLLEIVLFLPLGGRHPEQQPNPRVSVLSDLRGSPVCPNAPVPHIYPNPTAPRRPHLCLFHPPSGEWHLGLPLADTIVWWILEWLVCYEGWLATGTWVGGGIEH